MGGVAEVTDDPDVYVTYHGSSERNLRVNTDTWGYGYPSGWYRGGYYGGMGSSTTTVTSYQTGTLIVDVWDAETNELVWRGIADNIVVTENPLKMDKKIDKALKKIVDKSRKLRAKDAKTGDVVGYRSAP